MLEGLRERWDELVYSLEERGIPNWVLPLALVVILAIGYLVLFPSKAAGSAYFTVKTDAGDPVAGAVVTITSADGIDSTALTDVQGVATFSGLAEGEYTAAVSSQDYAFDSFGSSFSISAGGTAELSFTSQPAQTTFLSLSVQVSGVSSATIELLDSEEFPAAAAQTGVSTAQFQVLAGREYLVRVSAEGYSTETVSVTVGQSNPPLTTIELLPLGVEKKGILFIGVFDDEGIDGAPLENASVQVFDSDSNALLFDLKTGGAGTVESQEILLGKKLRVVASSEGFSSASKEIILAEQSTEQFRLKKTVEPQGYFLRTSGDAGALENVFIQLLDSNAKVISEISSNGQGNAEFPAIEKTQRFDVLAFKSGFLPVFQKRVASASEIKLEAADEDNSASIVVHVTDFNGNDVEGAFVFLKGEDGSHVGFPARKTGADGTQAFESIPLGKIRVFASNGLANASSDVIDVKPDTAVELKLPPGRGTVLFFVSDLLSLKPVAGALVSSNGIQCTTNSTGQCAASVTEGKTASLVTADGFEDFESSEFEVKPNVFQQQSFSLTSQAAAQAGLVFQGLFDLKGNKVKTLSPFTTYNAKFVLNARDLDFTKANAHVRVGAQDEPLDGYPVAITGFSASAAVIKGIDYSQFSQSETSSLLAQAGLKTVGISDNGFTPSTLVVTQGDSVTWVSQGSAKHSIVAEDGSFQSQEISNGGSFSRSFPTQGNFNYYDGTNAQLKGSILVVAKTQQQSTPSTPAGKGVKWLDFNFQPFKGSREINVQLKTLHSTGSFELESRSAFVTTATVLHNPADDQAGKSKNDFLANAVSHGPFEISSQGNCEQNFCLQYHFDNGRQSNFEAVFDQDFKLYVNVFSDDSIPVSFAGSEGVELTRVDFGGESVFAQDNAAFVQSAPEAGVFRAEAVFHPDKISSDSIITLKAGTVEKQLHLRILSPVPLVLKPQVSHKQIRALEPTQVSFKVEDSLGFPATSAVITVNGEQASELQNGVYQITLTPSKVENIDYEIAKEGFAKVRGSISVIAPDDLVSITPDALSLSLQNFKEGAAASLTVTNKIENDLSASTSLEFQTNPKLSSVVVLPGKQRLKKSDEVSFQLNASVLQSILPFAASSQALSEAVSGHVVIRTTLGGVSQQQRIPFVVTVTLRQEKFDDLWGVDQAPVELLLSKEKSSQESELKIVSSSTLPLLVNFDFADSEDVFIEPSSFELTPLKVQSFKLKKRLPSNFAQADCFDKQSEFNDTIGVVVSYKGISSKKAISVKSTFVDEEDCKAIGGGVASLPFAIEFSTATAPAVMKENSDGSLALRFTNSELAVISPGYSISENGIVSIPFSTQIALSDGHVSTADEGGMRVSLPFESNYIIDSTFEVKQEQNGLLVLTPASTALFPTGSRLGSDSSQRTVIRVAKNAFVEFADLQPEASPVPSPTEMPFGPNSGFTGSDGRPPWVNPTQLNPVPYNGMPVSIPVESLFKFPPGASSFDRSQASNIPGFTDYYSKQYPNLQGVLIPPSTKVAFDLTASISRATAGGVEVILPPNAQMVVPQEWVKFEKESLTLTLPVQIALKFPSDAEVVSGQDGKKNTVRFGGDFAVSFAFEPKFASGGKSVVVPAFSPMVFLRGAKVNAFEDTSIYSECDFEFKTGEESYIEFPDGSVTDGNAVILPQCQRLSISNAAGDELLLTPAVKKIVANSLDDPSAFSMRVAENKVITFKVCEMINGEKIGEDDENAQARITLTQDSSLELPSSAKVDGSVASLGGYKTVTVFDEGATYDLGVTKKLILTDFTTENRQGRLFAFAQEGSTVSFAPRCEKPRGVVSVTRSSSLVFEPNAITIVLNNSIFEGKSAFSGKPYVFSLQVFNKGSSEVRVDTVVEGGVKDSGVLTEKDLQFVDVYGNPSSAVSIQPIADQPNYFLMSFKPGEGALVQGKYGSCLNPEFDSKPVSGKLVFKTTQNRVSGIQEVPITVTYDSKSVACATTQIEEQTKNSRQIVASTLSSEGNDALPPVDPVFNFKGVGHVRFTAITNNDPFAVSMSLPDQGKVMSCFKYDNGQIGDASPASIDLQGGESVLLQCVSIRESSAPSEYRVKMTRKGTNQAVQIRDSNELVYHVQVFTAPEEMKELYSSTPIGRLWVNSNSFKATPTPVVPQVLPQGETPVSTFNYLFCQTNFCGSTDASQAFQNFVAVTAETADTELSSQSFVDAVCSQGADWRMSFVLNLANSKGNAELPESFAQSARDVKSKYGNFAGGFEFSLSPRPDLRGCGSYLIQARLDPVTSQAGFCSFKADSETKPFKLEFTAKKLMSCEETLANAPLLMPSDDVMFITGNELTDNALGISFNLEKASIEIGRYTTVSSEKDLNNAEILASSLYRNEKFFEGAQSKGFVESSKPFYDDALLCKKNVQPANVLFSSIQYGGAAVATGVAFLTKSPKAIGAAVEFAKAGIVSDASCAIIKARATNVCTAIDACTHLRFVLAADALFSIVNPLPVTNLKSFTPGYLLLATGEIGANAYLSNALEDPSLPYSGSSLERVQGALFGSQSQSSSVTGQFTALELSPITGAVISAGESKLIDDLERLVLNARADPSYWQKAVAKIKSPVFLRALANSEFERELLFRLKGAIPSIAFANSQDALNHLILENNGYLSKVKPPTTFVGKMKAFFANLFGFSKQSKLLGRTPATLGVGSTGATAQNTVRYSGLLRAVAPTIATLALNAFTNVQSEPVEAVFGDPVLNYVVAMHYTEKGLPSTVASCYYDPTSKQCDKQNRISLESACPDVDACLILTKLKTPGTSAASQAGLPSYALFFADNGLGEGQGLLFDSVFQPDSQPAFEGSVKGGTADKFGDAFAYSDSEDETAFDAEQSKEEAQSIVDSLSSNSQDANARVSEISSNALNSFKDNGWVSADDTIVEGNEAEIVREGNLVLQEISQVS